MQELMASKLANTCSQNNCWVKQHWAWLVLQWGYSSPRTDWVQLSTRMRSALLFWEKLHLVNKMAWKSLSSWGYCWTGRCARGAPIPPQSTWNRHRYKKNPWNPVKHFFILRLLFCWMDGVSGGQLWALHCQQKHDQFPQFRYQTWK